MTPTAHHPVHLFCRYQEDDPSSDKHVGEFDTAEEAAAFYRAMLQQGRWDFGAAVVREHCWFARVVCDDGLRIAPEDDIYFRDEDCAGSLSGPSPVLQFLLGIVRRRLTGLVKNRRRIVAKKGEFVPKVGHIDFQAMIIGRLGTIEAMLMDGVRAAQEGTCPNP